MEILYNFQILTIRPSSCCNLYHTDRNTSRFVNIYINQLLCSRLRTKVDVNLVYSLGKWFNDIRNESNKTTSLKYVELNSISAKTEPNFYFLNRTVNACFSDFCLVKKASQFACHYLKSTTANSTTIKLSSDRSKLSSNTFRKLKLSRGCVTYYSNRTASRNILLIHAGDVERNPGLQGTMTQDSDYLQDFAREIQNSVNNLSIAHINIRSLRNKVDEIKILLQVCCFDIFGCN